MQATLSNPSRLNSTPNVTEDDSDIVEISSSEEEFSAPKSTWNCCVRNSDSDRSDSNVIATASNTAKELATSSQENKCLTIGSTGTSAAAAILALGSFSTFIGSVMFAILSEDSKPSIDLFIASCSTGALAIAAASASCHFQKNSD